MIAASGQASANGFPAEMGGPIDFEFFSLKNATPLRTFSRDVNLREVESGEYKGLRYFQQGMLPVDDVVYPRDFVFSEFMALDPKDMEKLIDFQGRYGLIVPPLFDKQSIADHFKHPGLPGTSGDASFMMGKPEAGLTARVNEWMRGQQPWEGYASFAVPVIETARTVAVMQRLVAGTSRLRNDDYTEADFACGNIFVNLANDTIKEHAPVFGIAETSAFLQPFVVDPIRAVVLMHAETLSNNMRRIWKCSHCGKLFQYERREATNLQGDHFCSKECSSRFHQRKYDQSDRGRETRKRYREASCS